MCDFTKGIRLCTCDGEKIKYRKPDNYKKVRGQLVKIQNRKNDNIPLIYIWHLWRFKGINTECEMLGHYLFPNDDIGNGLNAEWIALNLNVENCFDFNYSPTEGDCLYITQNVEMSPYISFIFKNGEWIADHYDPFSDITELVSSGKITIP
ncbi:hypothetical protein [Chryseobacterium terrae]|uniref:Uncharacterized protein n=1 Tax=Chryseobacterium terrae TaxID=3163299 RepID=A0ABW8XZG1_9FLAO